MKNEDNIYNEGMKNEGKENIIKMKFYNFALRIVKLGRFLMETKKEFIISKQILRSGTSIGANIEEADAGQSKKDFIAKLAPVGEQPHDIYIVFFLLIIPLSLYSQEIKIKDYVFLDKYNNADLKYITYDSIYNSRINSCHGLPLLDNVFNIVDGKYMVYRFLNHYKDTFFFGGEAVLYDFWFLIILKTDKKDRIIDGYWSFLTDPEQPSCTLYRLSSQNVKLTHNLNIEKLQFKREPLMIDGEDICNELPVFLEDFLKEKGRLIW